MQPFPGVITSLQTQGAKYRVSGFIPTNKQTNKRSIQFRVLYQQTNKQTNLSKRGKKYSSGQITLDPQNFGRKQKDKKKINFPVISRRGISHMRLWLYSQTFVPETKKVSCGKFPRRDTTGNVTFFYPAASCRNFGGPELSVRCSSARILRRILSSAQNFPDLRSGQITLDPQNFGRKQQDKKRSIFQSYLVVRFPTRDIFFF